MDIEIRCYATLAAKAPPSGRASVSDGTTIGALLDELAIDPEEARIVFVNGSAASLDRPLSDGDRVGIFPPVGGG